jgi:hypothetical protein
LANYRFGWFTSLLLGAVLIVPELQAQSGGDGFLFKHPHVTWSFRGGYAVPSASSDIFSFTTSQLTVARHDFDALTFGTDLAIRLSPRVDLFFGGSYAGEKTPSEFRNWVDQNNLPIQQTTSFVRLPLTAGLKAYLTPRGRSIGKYAWIPARYALYAGAGVGAMWYRFRQTGDFVDYQTLDVFPDQMESEGWAPTAQGLLGLEVSLMTRLAVSVEGRYTLARADLSKDFQGFNPIDLSGASATVGLAVRF